MARPALEPGSRLRNEEIQIPGIDELVEIDAGLYANSCSMYTTSSVATLPEAPLA